MNTHNTHKWIMYIISGLFAVSAVFCILSLSYTSVEKVTANSLEDRIHERHKALEEASKKEATFSEWRNIKEHFSRFKSDYLLGMEEFSRFRDELQMIFNKYQLVSSPPQYKYKGLYKDYIQASISFSLSGSYPNLKRFILDIMNREKMIMIKKMQFSRSLQRGDISASFIMEVYLAR